MQAVKYLQAQGIGSRKLCRLLLARGRVAVNGETVDEDAEINAGSVCSLTIDGESLVVIPLPFYYILLNKPSGYETSHRPRDYPSVFSLFPDHLRVTDMQAVGRLDADTTGVLLITNDGAFNHRMTSPKHHVAKRYRVGLKHAANADFCRRLTDGVLLHDDNEIVRAAAAELTDDRTLLLTICEGKYHQVKRMVAAAGNRVEMLHREQFHVWDVRGLAAGEWRFFVPEE